MRVHTHTHITTKQEAGSYTCNAACQLDNGSSALCKISGIGKYPYLSIEQSLIDFGNVTVGKTVERTIRWA